MDDSRRSEHAASFTHAAGEYAAVRPGYPDEAVDLLLPPGARDVLDLAAGTGKLTAALVARGVRVVAVEPADGMREQLRASLPDVEVHAGTAEAIPLPDASVDVVTVAQAWHWFDEPAAAAEVARVLRPGGFFLTGFQVGQGTRTATGYYLGEQRITAHLFTTDQVSDVLGDAGFEVLATCTTAPAEARYPQGFVLARRSRDTGVDDR